jgi:hypothetical protein
MNIAPIARGSTSGDSLLTRSLLSIAAASTQLWLSFSTQHWLPAFGALCFAIAAFDPFTKWLAYRRGTCRIQWEGTHIQILDRGRIEYDGDLAGLHQVDQDGRGYFLYLTSKVVFRLRRGRSNPRFEAALDRIQEAEQGVAPQSATRSESNFSGTLQP